MLNNYTDPVFILIFIVLHHLSIDIVDSFNTHSVYFLNTLNYNTLIYLYLYLHFPFGIIIALQCIYINPKS